MAKERQIERKVLSNEKKNSVKEYKNLKGND